MLWFSPRSYLKWAGAVAVVGISWWIQLMPGATTLHPFARADIPAGTPISDGMFEFRDVPAGLLPPVTVGGILTAAMATGDPLLPTGVTSSQVPVPDGWWAVEMPTPPGLVPGQRVMLVAGGEGPWETGQAISGIVLRRETQSDGPQDLTLVAVAQEHLATVSSASAYGTLTVAVAPDR